MPQYVYTGEDERAFLAGPTIQVGPGDTVEADENPDPAWFASPSSKAGRAAKARAKQPTAADPGPGPATTAAVTLDHGSDDHQDDDNEAGQAGEES